MWKTLKTLISSKTADSLKTTILFKDIAVSGNMISDQFNKFFIQSINEIVNQMHPNKSDEEIVSIIDYNCKLERFSVLEMSDIKKVIKKMQNK